MRNKFKEPLPAKQVPVVVLIVLLTAAAVYGSYRGLAALWHRHKLEQTIPASLAGVRAEMATLSSLIENYKGRFGYYPPLLTPPGSARGVLNPLCYELMGSRYAPKSKAFYIPATKDALTAQDVEKYFSMASFSNCLASPNAPTNFLANRALPVQPLEPGSGLFGIGLTYTEFVPEDFWGDYEFSPWRYATSPAQHNPGKFDIWVQQVSGSNPVQITKGPGQHWQPDWSPDGKYIAYRS